jgi:ABC-2 type transport system ATP-binding protein
LSLKLINAKNLTKSFDDFIAVNNIDLDIKKDPLRAKGFIGYLPEGAPTYSDMEVCDFLSFIGQMRGLDNKKLLSSRLSDMADQINLKEVWNRPIETLSKGFKRRVGIAQALIHDPDILILDEPTDGLDPNQKHEMRSLIKNISKNKAIVISTHILEEVEAVCSRAIIIADGKLLANEKPENLGNKFLQTDAVSIKISDNIDKKIINEIKSSLTYKTVNIKLIQKKHYEVLIEDKKENLNLNKIMTELKKYKLNIYEASFLKDSLDDVFRKITQQK